MVRIQNRKREPADELSQEAHHRAAKSVKPTIDYSVSPTFWDNLSKVWLTKRALRELDRRNNKRPVQTYPTPEICLTDLARFARRGGPDLGHLRGVSYTRSFLNSQQLIPSF